MNLILLEPYEVDSKGCAVLTGRRSRHVREVLQSESGESLRAGVLGGRMGMAHVIRVENEKVHIQLEPGLEPPEPLPLTLVLALPRPKVLRRIIAHVTTLGVKEIYLINAYRVEKPYWSSEQVREESIRRACLLGLEQARDTILPRVILEKRFKPFVEDRLPPIIAGTRALVAHPSATEQMSAAILTDASTDGATASDHGRGCERAHVTLVIGPEGGFIPYEIELLQKIGCRPVTLGERILKTETAIPYLIGRLGKI